MRDRHRPVRNADSIRASTGTHLLRILVIFLFWPALQAFGEENRHDVTERVEWLGSPYQERYSEGEKVYARNIWDMRAFQGALYIGAGNSSNIGPAPNAGPVPIIRFDRASRSFVREGKVDDEQIDLFQVNEGQLYIPGHDPRESWDWGNYYQRDGRAAWIKHRNIPGGLHTYGLAWYRGKLFAALGIKGGAAISISDDHGDTWSVVRIGRTRTNAFLQVAGKLYATKYFPSTQRWKTRQAERQMLLSPVYEFQPPGDFIVRQDLTSAVMFPGMVLDASREAKVVRPLIIGESSVYIGAYTHNDHQYLPFGVFLAASLVRDQLRVERIPLSAEEQPWDILFSNGYLYVLTSRKEGAAVRVRVWRASQGRLTQLSEVLEFSAPTFARSFEILGDDFYFGLGCEVDDPGNWRQEELPQETGQILRVTNSVPH